MLRKCSAALTGTGTIQTRINIVPGREKLKEAQIRL